MACKEASPRLAHSLALSSLAFSSGRLLCKELIPIDLKSFLTKENLLTLVCLTVVIILVSIILLPLTSLLSRARTIIEISLLLILHFAFHFHYK